MSNRANAIPPPSGSRTPARTPPPSGRGQGVLATRYLRAISAILFALALAACGPASSSDTSATPTPTSTPTGTLADRACPVNSILTYADFGAPFMSNHCTSCHSSTVTGDERRGAPAGFDFDTLSGVQSHADRIYARAADGYAEMPPAGGPAAVERLELGDWLACGTP